MENKIVLYKSPSGNIDLKVNFDGQTVWLTQKQMADLFSKDVRTVNEHISNVFKEGELFEKSVIREFRITEYVQKIHILRSFGKVSSKSSGFQNGTK